MPSEAPAAGGADEAEDTGCEPSAGGAAGGGLRVAAHSTQFRHQAHVVEGEVGGEAGVLRRRERWRGARRGAQGEARPFEEAPRLARRAEGLFEG